MEQSIALLLLLVSAATAQYWGAPGSYFGNQWQSSFRPNFYNPYNNAFNQYAYNPFVNGGGSYFNPSFQGYRPGATYFQQNNLLDRDNPMDVIGNGGRINRGQDGVYMPNFGIGAQINSGANGGNMRRGIFSGTGPFGQPQPYTAPLRG